MIQHRNAAQKNSQLPVHCAWRKYGEPIIEIIGKYETHEYLNLAEIAAIRDYETLAPNGYNLSYGGDTSPALNPEVAAKIGKAAIGRKYADTSSWSNASTRSWKNAEYREKVSEGLKKSWTDEMRKAAGERSKARWEKKKAEGWVMPESQKEKLRNKVVTDETRSRMSNSAKGKKKPLRSEITRLKISENTKLAWSDKELSENRVKAIKAAWDETARKSMGEKAKNSWSNPDVRERRIAAIRESYAKKRALKNS